MAKELVLSLQEKLTSLRARQSFLKELDKEGISLATLLILFERGSWQTMQANEWAGFKALVSQLGPVKIPAYPKQNFPFIFCNWEISKIAEIIGASIHEVGLTFLYLKYPSLADSSLASEVINEADEGVDKQKGI